MTVAVMVVGGTFRRDLDSENQNWLIFWSLHPGLGSSSGAVTVLCLESGVVVLVLVLVGLPLSQAGPVM